MYTFRMYFLEITILKYILKFFSEIKLNFMRYFDIEDDDTRTTLIFYKPRYNSQNYYFNIFNII